MSSTNKTTYYNLSQFANNDKPSWLNDYNNDMTIIDTNLKLNSNNISSNTNNIGDLTNLTTTSKTNVVSAINEVDSNTDTNTTSIGDLTSLTTTAKTDLVSAINEVASSSGGGSSLSKWELTTFDTYNAANWNTKGCTYTGAIQSLSAMTITIDTNSDSSIFSIYGTINLSAVSAGEITITFPTTLNNTTEQEFLYSGLNIERINESPIVKVKAENNGKLTIKFFAKSGNNYVMFLNIPRVINFS